MRGTAPRSVIQHRDRRAGLLPDLFRRPCGHRGHPGNLPHRPRRDGTDAGMLRRRPRPAGRCDRRKLPQELKKGSTMSSLPEYEPHAPKPAAQPRAPERAGPGMKGHLIRLGGFLLMFAVLLVFLSNLTPTNTSLPPKQADLIRTLSQARGAYEAAGSNDFQQNAIWESRHRALCALGSTGDVEDWVGRVYDIRETRLGGSASLTVEIGDRIWLETYGTAFAELDNPTNIQKGTELFGVVASLNKGDRIKFGGNFVVRKPQGPDVGCAIERSATRAGSMREPELIFRFKYIARQ